MSRRAVTAGRALVRMLGSFDTEVAKLMRKYAGPLDDRRGKFIEHELEDADAPDVEDIFGGLAELLEELRDSTTRFARELDLVEGDLNARRSR